MHIKTLKKAVSVLTLATFILTNSIYAAPESKSIFKNKKVDYQKISDKNENTIQQKKAILSGEDVKQSESQKKETQRILSTHLSDISLIHIPEEVGRVVEVYQNPDQDNSKLVVHIQDLHTNPEASLNLAKILEILLKDYKLGLVCSEGADGVVDTSSVSSFPDAEVREKVARLFIDSGELTGEEFLSITKYPDLAIWGIENKEVYFKNIAEFNSIMKFNPDSQVFISQAKKALEGLKPRIYSKELLSIDQKESDYESQKIETADYLKYLSSYIQKLGIPTVNYKNITLLNETTLQEFRIDQQKIMQESQGLLLNLQSAVAGKPSRSDMDTLTAKAGLFKDQKISPFSFYSYLKDLADKHLKAGLAEKYPNLMDFVDYLTKVNSLDSTNLFIEMENLTYDIKQRLAGNDEERTLTQALRSIKFLDSFFNLRVSNEELDYYLQNRDFHKVGYFESFLKPAIKKHNLSSFVDFNPGLIDSHLQELEDFYKIAKSRDLIMFNNAVSEIEKRNVKVAALVTGGFHTKGLTRLLKDKGYSYIVISPYSKTTIDEENYHFLLSGKRRPIEELIKELDVAADETSKVSANLRVPMMLYEKDAVSKISDGDLGRYRSKELQTILADKLNIRLTFNQINSLPGRIKKFLKSSFFVKALINEEVSASLQEARYEIGIAGLQGIENKNDKIKYIGNIINFRSKSFNISLLEADYAKKFGLDAVKNKGKISREISNIVYYLNQFKPVVLPSNVAKFKITSSWSRYHNLIPFEFGEDNDGLKVKDALEYLKEGKANIILLGSSIGEEFIKIQFADLSDLYNYNKEIAPRMAKLLNIDVKDDKMNLLKKQFVTAFSSTIKKGEVEFPVDQEMSFFVAASLPEVVFFTAPGLNLKLTKSKDDKVAIESVENIDDYFPKIELEYAKIGVNTDKNFTAEEETFLAKFKYHETEEATTIEFGKKIKEGLDVSKYNAIKEKMKGSTAAINLQKQTQEDIDRWAKRGKKIKTASGFSAGGLSTRTKGLFNAGFTFQIPGLVPDPVSFTKIKFAAAAKDRDDLRKADDDPTLQQDILIMNSFQTAGIVEKSLEENDYFNYGKEMVDVFTQGIQIRLNPSDEFLQKYRKDKETQLKDAVAHNKISDKEMQDTLAALDRGISEQMGKAGEPLRTYKGNLIFNPPGHWDFIRWAVLSNVLAKLKKNKTEMVFYSHMNNPAGKVSDVLKGLFSEEIDKAKKEGRPEPVFMVLLADNRGERGGFYADVTYEDGTTREQIVENPALPEDVKREIKNMNNEELSKLYPYFNSGMFLSSVDGLLKLFGLPDDYDKRFDFKKLAEIVNKIDIPVVVDVKENEEDVDGVKYTYVGLQLERYTGDFTRIWPYTAAVINRDEDFVPIKTLDEVDLGKKTGQGKMKILAKALEPIKDYLVSSEEKSDKREDIIEEITEEQYVVETLIGSLKKAIIERNNTAVSHISSLLKAKGPAAVNPMIRELKFSDDARVCVALVACLSDIGTEPAVEVLKEILVSGGYAGGYVEAARGLGKAKEDPEATDILVEYGLKSENQYVRRSTAEALGKKGDIKAKGPLMAVLKNTKEKLLVREAVAMALGNFNDPDVKRVLEEILKKETGLSLKKAAAIGLNIMDSIAKERYVSKDQKKTLALLTPAKETKRLGLGSGPRRYAYFPKDIEIPVGNGEKVLSKSGSKNNPIKPGTKVVIGAAGMIGHEAAKQLASQGEEVVTVDNLLLGSPANDDIPGVKLLRQDASKFCREYRPEDYKNIKGIVYLGGYSSEPQFVSRGFPQWLNWTGTPQEIAEKWNKMVDTVGRARKIDKISVEEVEDAQKNTKAEFAEVLRVLYNDFSPELALYASRFPHCVTQEWLTSMYEFKSVMDLAVMYGIRVVFASTSSFCKLFPPGEPVTEVPTRAILNTFNRIQSDPAEEKRWITVYEFTKLGMELMAMHYHNKKGVDVYASRNFSVYNAGQQELQKGRYANMVAQVIWAIENDQSVPIFIMPGDFARDVIFVSDLAKGILHIMKHASWEGTPANSAAVFNVGLKKVWGMNEVIASVMEALSMGELGNVLYRMPTPGFPGTMIGDPTKVQGIGWTYDYPFGKALKHIFFANEEEYRAAVARWESEHAPVGIDGAQLEGMGFKKIADNVYRHSVYTLLLNANDGSLRGFYIDRKKIGPPMIKIYRGPDLYEDPENPTVCTKNTGKIEEIIWPKRSIDYDKKVIPLRYDNENRRLVLLNGDNEISVGRQLGWVAEEVKDNSNAVQGSVLDNLQRLVNEGVLQKATEGVYLTADDNILLVYNQDMDNIELVTAKPHVGVMSDPITNSTTIRGLVQDNKNKGEELCRLHIGNRDLFIDEEGRTRYVEIPKDAFAEKGTSTALMVVTQKSDQLVPYSPITNTALIKLEKVGAETVAQIEMRLKSGRDRDRNFLGENDSLKQELVKANTEVVTEHGLSHVLLGRVLVDGINRLDKAYGPAGMIEIPIRFHDEYTGQDFEVSHVMSDRLGSAFNELPPPPLRGMYRIKNLETGREIIFQGQLADMISRYGFYGGPGAAKYFRIAPKDLIELLGYDKVSPRNNSEIRKSVELINPERNTFDLKSVAVVPVVEGGISKTVKEDLKKRLPSSQLPVMPIEQFNLVPAGYDTADESLKAVQAVTARFKDITKAIDWKTVDSPAQVLKWMTQAINETPGGAGVFISIDVNADSLRAGDGTYYLGSDAKQFGTEQKDGFIRYQLLAEYYQLLATDFSRLIGIERAFARDHDEAWEGGRNMASLEEIGLDRDSRFASLSMADLPDLTSRITSQVPSRFYGSDFLRNYKTGAETRVVRNTIARSIKDKSLATKGKAQAAAYAADSWRTSLKYEPKHTGMGTSGFRGRVDDMRDAEPYAISGGFVKWLISKNQYKGIVDKIGKLLKIAPGQKMALAGDFRDSSPDFMAAVLKAYEDLGIETVFLGNMSTPNFAYYCQTHKIAGIMITGSHTEGLYNGLKLYDMDGEVLNEADPKDGDIGSDREEIMAQVDMERELLYNQPVSDSIFDENGYFKKTVAIPDAKALIKTGKIVEANQAGRGMYVDRYLTDMFKGHKPFNGHAIIYWEHSTVVRSEHVAVLEGLGAEVIRVGRRDDAFIALDTENMTKDHLSYLKEQVELVKKICHAETLPDGRIEIKVDREAYEKLREAGFDVKESIVGKTLVLLGESSSDGDGDRSVVVDERGKFWRGDVTGAIVGETIKANYFVQSLTGNQDVRDYLEKLWVKFVDSSVGSPYHVYLIRELLRLYPDANIIGQEVNGGTFIGSRISIPVRLPNGEEFNVDIDPLNTRDAATPMLIVFLRSVIDQVPVSTLFEGRLDHYADDAGLIHEIPVIPGSERTGVRMHKRYTPEGRFGLNIKHVTFDDSANTMTVTYRGAGAEPVKIAYADEEVGKKLLTLRNELEGFFTPVRGFGKITQMAYGNQIDDGFVMWDTNYDRFHVRKSGNAPETRIYVYADKKKRGVEAGNRRAAEIRRMAAEPGGILREIEASVWSVKEIMDWLAKEPAFSFDSKIDTFKALSSNQSLAQAQQSFVDFAARQGILGIKLDRNGGAESANGKSYLEVESPDYYFRGANSHGYPAIQRVIVNALIEDKEEFSRREDDVCYVMNHGFIPMPDNLRQLVEAGVTDGRIRDTYFPQVDPCFPGSGQFQQTGGHYQENSLDIKFITEGKGLQILVWRDKQDRLRTLVQEMSPGKWVYALPGTADFIVNLGGLRFSDVSYKVDSGTEERMRKALEIDDNFNGEALAALPKAGAAYVFEIEGGGYKAVLDGDNVFGGIEVAPPERIGNIAPVTKDGQINLSLIDLYRKPETLLGLYDSEFAIRVAQNTKAIAAFKANPALLKIHCEVQHYDWGDPDYIPALLEIDNSEGKPYAELWIGAHPKAPAKANVIQIEIAMNDLISGAAEEILGKEIAGQFNNQLPYLLKVLAARKMLSIQAHPNKAQATEGFGREDMQGIQLDAANRNYKDANHKPEIILALDDFYGLNGFRDLDEIAEVLENIEEFQNIIPDFKQRLEAAGQNKIKREDLLREFYSKIMNLSQEGTDIILTPLIDNLKAKNRMQPFNKDDREFWVLEADKQYTKDGHIDRGIFSIYLLNLVHLRPDEAMYLGAGELHAYLEGVGIECMANSDNVLRGGLTPKYIDVPELLKILTFNSGKPKILKPQEISDTEVSYDTPAEEFALSVIEVTSENPHKDSEVHSADALLVLEGNVEIKSEEQKLRLGKGETAIVPAVLGAYEIVGKGKLFKASVPFEFAQKQDKLTFIRLAQNPEIVKKATQVKLSNLESQYQYAALNNLWIFAYNRADDIGRELYYFDREGMGPKYYVHPLSALSSEDVLEKAKEQPELSDLGKLALRGLLVSYDGISPDLPDKYLDMMKRDGLMNVTTNGPLILANLKHFEAKIRELAREGKYSIEEIYNQIVAAGLVREAAQKLRPARDSGESSGVSLEVRSHITDPNVMVEEAKLLAGLVGVEGMVMNKIPATDAGIIAIKDAIKEGLYPNVTVVFCSRTQIRAVAKAIAEGLILRVEKLLSEGKSPTEIIEELAKFKSFISYFVSRITTLLMSDEEVIRAIRNAKSKSEKQTLLKFAMDSAEAFYVDGHEMFLEELRKAGFSDLEKLGASPTIELDASTGEKAVKADSAFVKALTEGDGAIGIDELAKQVLIEGKENLYENWGYYVYRMNRPGSMDTNPIAVYNKIVEGKGAKNVPPMTLDEARVILMEAEQKLNLTEDKWEAMAKKLLDDGIKSFIKAEQDLRIGMLEVVVDEAVKQGKFEYALKEINNIVIPDVTSADQLKRIDVLRLKVPNRIQSLSSAAAL